MNTAERPEGGLAKRLAGLSTGGADELLERFLSYAAELGLELYPAQEEAILEILEGRHVILATPTGSGKSLVAAAMVFRTVANGGRAFYTCPIKALVNEKFFQLADAFGAKSVGLMTGDASVNTEAPIVCCTAEIAASMCLRRGLDANIDALVMDEFHYYGDRDRGAAWHIPLLVLERTHFLLMSATLGDARPFLERLEKLTGRKASLVSSSVRPVPLDFSYSEEPLHEAVKHLVEKGRAPVYVVCFTQRASAEEAQNLMSENYTSKDDKRAIVEALDGFRFDSPYGKDVARFVRHGIGLHHAGLLPKYRLLVERLAQRGLLKVICGTDTLGVGVNIPIRTVLFTRLCKFDGEKTTLLSAREFLQIAGRAGRKGFDELGSVVVQAPEHVIENIRIDRKKEQDPKKHKNLQRAKPPTRGYVHWDRAVFERLVAGTPEDLAPRLSVTHGMIVDLLDNPSTGPRGGYGMLLDLIDRSHLSERDKRRERKLAPVLFRSLRRAGIVELHPRGSGKRGKVALVSQSLQRDFSLHHALSLWLVDYLEVLSEGRTSEPEYAKSVLSAVEAILESPRAILERQIDKRKGERLAELKAAGVEYEERMVELEKVDHEKPDADLIYETYNTFVTFHPWAGADNIRPKSIARDMFERGASFDEYVREYDLVRMEGVLLRYLSDAVKTLEQSVPADFKTGDTDEIYFFLLQEVRSTDSSLLDEWERRAYGSGAPTRGEAARPEKSFADDPKAVLVRVRRELHRLVKALAAKNWEAAASAVRPSEAVTPKTIEAWMRPFFEERGQLLAHHGARQAEHTTLKRTGDRTWQAWQALVDPERAGDWSIEVAVDLTGTVDEAAPVIDLVRIGSG
jgi:superfamily II RNA helicase